VRESCVQYISEENGEKIIEIGSGMTLQTVFFLRRLKNLGYSVS